MIVKLKKVLFEKGNFLIAAFVCTDLSTLPPHWQGNANVIVKGFNIPTPKDVEMDLTVEMVTDAKHGQQFEYKGCYTVLQPKTTSAMVSYLSSEFFPGVGKRIAEKIVKKFDLQAIDIIANDHEKLAKIFGISKNKANEIHDAYLYSVAYSETAKILTPFGISRNQIVHIVDKFGSQTTKIIQNEPYKLSYIPEISFKTIDKIGLGMGAKANDTERIALALKEAIRLNCEGGDMYMALDKIVPETLKLLNSVSNDKVTEEECKKVLTEETSGKTPNLVCRFNKYIFISQYDAAERNVAVKLLQMLANKTDVQSATISQSVTDYVEASPIKLHITQQEAVVNSLSHRVGIITGGPGTGKTTVIKCVIETYEKLFGGRVTCMAPTGKAAQRMSEATGKHARTIHSQLKLGDSNSNKKPEKIKDGLVIIDEVSMVDNFLMDNLLEALTEDCMLILVGDINQLPSVGSGDVLNQLIASGKIPCTKLTKTFRQVGENSIVDNAYRIINGDANHLSFDEKTQFVFAKNEQEAKKWIELIYKKECEAFGIAQVALLTPRRKTNNKFICVADALNPILQDLANPMTATLPVFKANGKEYRLHDRVMQMKNCSSSANGEVGEIVNIDEEGDDNGPYVEVKWDTGDTVQMRRKDLETVSLAYSMSVHKSQGSEYDSVIIPILSEQDCALFKRNMLYTAITRAKKRVILIGDANELSRCIARQETGVRKSLLAQRIIYNSKTIH